MTNTTTSDRTGSTHRGVVGLALRLLCVVGLAITAYVHFDLAKVFDANAASISQGTLFRVEAIACVVVASAVLLLAHRAAALAAFLVAAGALAAILLYRYVDVGAFGPFPDMYEPVWYPEKTLSAFSSAGAALIAAVLVLLPRRRTRSAD